MAYENLKLANAAISGDIYLTRILKNGVMSDNRRIITNECLSAKHEIIEVHYTSFSSSDWNVLAGGTTVALVRACKREVAE
ncbi:hypothetical protein IT795_002446 [Listeria monocytogenes]|nr:hypothetical protein [Listeria monocytogenes]